MRKSICYFSYCRDNSSEIMDYLKEQIEKKSNGSIKVVFDKKSFLYSEDFIKREREIISCETVVIFFSREYKNIIDERKSERGVYREYEFISSKFKKNPESIIEVLLNGNVNTAITKEFSTRIAADFSGGNVLYKARNKRIVVNDAYRSSMTNLISTIIRKTNDVARNNNYQFKSLEEKYESLFCDTKSNGKLPKECMYKTSAYISIMSQRCMFIIGRKGAGKTTFFELLEKYEENGKNNFDECYKVLKPISAESINVGQIYTIVNRYEADLELFPIARMLQLFWKVYIYFCAIYIVCLEEENCRITDEKRRKIIHRVGLKIKRIFNIKKLDTDNIQETIFTQSATFFEDFIKNNIIDYATAEAFEASMVANFTVQNVFAKFLEDKLYRQFLIAISHCTKKVMIALDGFDTLSDDFRINTNFKLQKGNEDDKLEGEKRALFERLFFRSFVNAINSMRDSDDELINNTDFCIVLPKDRLDQIETVDRDISKTNFADLSWDAIELLEVVVLRLEYIFEIEKDSKLDLWERLSYIMREYLPAIPEEVQIEIKGNMRKVNLFEYLLRLSFWRPRDILKYYALLYSANQSVEDPRNIKLDVETIKLSINNKADDIISNEFLGEYNKVFINISKVIDEFHGQNIVMSAEEIFGLLSRIPFVTTFEFDCDQTINKIRLLYDLGVIGLKIPTNKMKQHGIGHEWCFIFNEGTRPLDTLKMDFSPESTEIRFVINPIFNKKLELKFNTTEIVGVFGKDYLIENHARKMAIKRSF